MIIKKAKKTACTVLCAGIALSAAAGSFAASAETEEKALSDMTTMEIVKDMGLGINLGNTFESCGSWINGSSVTNYETAWGSPVITKEMIQGYADSGFGVMRLPVAWSNLMGDDYTIDPGYISRVKEIVDWACDADLYVIMNIHWDGGWWENFPTDKETCMYKYERIWTQLCEAFKDYDEQLMFESLNEEGGWDSLWNRYGGSTSGKAESFGLLNEINQKFVDIVRNSGGNNSSRHLLIAGYNTDVQLTCDDLYEMPDDPANRCAVSIHYYTPSTFCILEEDASWGKAETEWGDADDLAELDRNLNMLKETFIDKGVPVIMGEYGVAAGNKTREQVNNYLITVASEAYARDICPVLWDTTNDHSVYNRYTCQMNDSELEAAYRNITGSADVPGTDSSEAESSQPVSDTESESSSESITDVSSADVSEPEEASSEATASISDDESLPAASAVTSSSVSSAASAATDTNPSTGGGIALTGLALLGAAVLTVKKKK
ncbi:cellulase family glycosylhydrolase [Ruminococcus sp. Marseille-P6503]|uniref:cellulase family glycosylhydrolase n=1 Tax=Ruminococcus sp. Marseille-P6503 TaxID=2364796 RepID=UPI000F53BAEA|nr:cellulase family glycosylhydrolase [Ruminococcus sp. Marseille-P6503]